MKKISLLFFTLFLFVGLNQNLYSQDYRIILTIMDPLPEVDFSAFAMTNNLSGAPRIMSIEIFTPTPNERVILEGKIDWQKEEGGSFTQLFWFRTVSFSARNISNTDIGNSIQIADNNVVSNLVQENFRKGRPTGSYRITVVLRDSRGAIIHDASGAIVQDVKEISFLNPTQTLTITSPEVESTQDIGNVLASWDAVIGASHFGLKANVRIPNRNGTKPGLEEALNTGNPLIDTDDIGNITIASLREHLIREWLPGQEIVFQVSAYIPGTGGGTTLYSNIINFYIGSSVQVDNQILDLLQLLSDVTGQDLVQRYRDGQIDMSSMRITLEDGRSVSPGELNEILTYLRTNPDKVISVSLQRR